MAKMTQTQIIAEMSTKTGIAKKQVKDFLASLTDLAYREAKKGEFALPGLGKLVKQKRKARTALIQRRNRSLRFQPIPSSNFESPRPQRKTIWNSEEEAKSLRLCSFAALR